ncbi:hypothetical protein E2C01_085228 [Portunus trituberculatus]|uniref:Uncharacterized protein n=1 Tax=Portunus trituberculatus TaxID=210409 RepID=A0A5B7J220_PORTR|nr:hypothetical protein [Portunus trituberculatus]
MIDKPDSLSPPHVRSPALINQQTRHSVFGVPFKLIRRQNFFYLDVAKVLVDSLTRESRNTICDENVCILACTSPPLKCT